MPLPGGARPLFALLAASSVYAWIYLRALAAGGDPHFLCDVVADGELLLLSALVLLTTLIPFDRLPARALPLTCGGGTPSPHDGA